MNKPHLITRCFNSASGATTVALERQFWDAFDDILGYEGKTLGDLLRQIDRQRHGSGSLRQEHPRISLASAVRTYVLGYFYVNRPRSEITGSNQTRDRTIKIS